jgi:hypothetical protein
MGQMTSKPTSKNNPKLSVVSNAKPASREAAPSNAQRALWTFLLITLVAPFFAAVVIFLGSVGSGYFGRGPASLLALDRAGQFAWAALKAVETYVWSALPAGIAAAAFAAIVYARGTAPWLAAASIAAIVASAMSLFAGGMMAQHLTPMAFIAALVGIAMWAVLRRAGIITS